MYGSTVYTGVKLSVHMSCGLVVEMVNSTRTGAIFGPVFVMLGLPASVANELALNSSDWWHLLSH